MGLGSLCKGYRYNADLQGGPAKSSEPWTTASCRALLWTSGLTSVGALIFLYLASLWLGQRGLASSVPPSVTKELCCMKGKS